MGIDPHAPPPTLDLDRTRYNPATLGIWPGPAVLLEVVAAWIKELPGDLWLDAACGECKLGELLGKRKSLLGLDIDWRRLGRARGHPYVALIQGSVEALPLPRGSLNGIATVETLEHVADMEAALKEFARRLRTPG